MDGNKPHAATWVLCVDIDPDNPESDPVLIGSLDMPLDGGLISGGLIRGGLAANMDEATARAARVVCQALDVALKRHIERGGDSDTPEMLTDLHIDPMGDIRDARS